MPDRPVIIIFSDESNPELEWASCGWGSDPVLMAKAREAIDGGVDYRDTIDRLRLFGFEVEFER